MSFLDTLKGMFGGKKDAVEAANVAELKQKITEQASGTLGQTPDATVATPEAAAPMQPQPASLAAPVVPPVESAPMTPPAQPQAPAAPAPMQQAPQMSMQPTPSVPPVPQQPPIQQPPINTPPQQ